MIRVVQRLAKLLYTQMMVVHTKIAMSSFSIFSGKEVIQKILEKGHTQMECDSVHTTIEKSIKNRNIYVPADYAGFAANAKCSSPYTVKYLSANFFFLAFLN